MPLARWQATIVDDQGNVVPNASIEVRSEVSGQPLASLYSDRDGVTPLGNAFAADAEGFAAFHVAGGAYQIKATLGAFSRTWRYVAIGTGAELDQEAVLSSVGRPILTGNRTYYVSASGNDTNDGLSSGSPFATLQKAWDVIAALDLGTYSLTISVADGTYTAGIITTSAPVGGSQITIQGNTVTPANAYLNGTDHGFSFSADLPCRMAIKGFKIKCAGASKSGVRLNARGEITTSDIDAEGGSTGFAGFYQTLQEGARIIVSSNQTISGGMSSYVACTSGIIQFYGITVTLTGTPAFSWVFATATYIGFILAPNVTWSGAATGTRYSVNRNSVIDTAGNGANYFPGDAAGSASTGGQYV